MPQGSRVTKSWRNWPEFSSSKRCPPPSLTAFHRAVTRPRCTTSTSGGSLRPPPPNGSRGCITPRSTGETPPRRTRRPRLSRRFPGARCGSTGSRQAASILPSSGPGGSKPSAPPSVPDTSSAPARTAWNGPGKRPPAARPTRRKPPVPRRPGHRKRPPPGRSSTTKGSVCAPRLPAARPRRPARVRRGAVPARSKAVGGAFGAAAVRRIAEADLPSGLTDPDSRALSLDGGIPRSRGLLLPLHRERRTGRARPRHRTRAAVPEKPGPRGPAPSARIGGILCLDGSTGRVFRLTTPEAIDADEPSVTPAGDNLAEPTRGRGQLTPRPRRHARASTSSMRTIPPPGDGPGRGGGHSVRRRGHHTPYPRVTPAPPRSAEP
ncbi:SUKH-4 family immunity protein [Streptomyces pinistramenti]|uniref:SUKH-4 family immunity protein n=1 Tax=Streptomyces pinistramenti TaxID=2884812 RepID=UPI0035569839